MKFTIFNKTTGKVDTLYFKHLPAEELKNLANSLLLKNDYNLCVIAETAQDVDFISSNFHNLPLPASPASKAVWTGEMALFIIINYPSNIIPEE